MASGVIFDVAKHERAHHGVVNRTEIHLETRRHSTPESRFFVEQAIEFTSVFDVASSVAEIIGRKTDSCYAANVVELLM